MLREVQARQKSRLARRESRDEILVSREGGNLLSSGTVVLEVTEVRNQWPILKH